MRRQGPRRSCAERIRDVPAGRRRDRFARQPLRRRRIQQSRHPLRQPTRSVHRPKPDRNAYRVSRPDSKRNRDSNISDRDADAYSNRDLGHLNANFNSVSDRIGHPVAHSYANADRILDSYFGIDADANFDAHINRIFNGYFGIDTDADRVGDIGFDFDGDTDSDRNADLDADRVGDSNCERDRNFDRHCDFSSLRNPVSDADHGSDSGSIRDRDRHSDRNSHTDANADSDRHAHAAWLARSISAQPEPRKRSVRRGQDQQAETRRNHQHQHSTGDLRGHSRKRRLLPRKRMRPHNRTPQKVQSNDKILANRARHTQRRTNDHQQRNQLATSGITIRQRHHQEKIAIRLCAISSNRDEVPHLIFTLSAGVTPAQGSVKPTAGFTLNKVIYDSECRWIEMRPIQIDEAPFVGRALAEPSRDDRHRLQLSALDRLQIKSLVTFRDKRCDFERRACLP
jgi:hypothetical protein